MYTGTPSHDLFKRVHARGHSLFFSASTQPAQGEVIVPHCLLLPVQPRRPQLPLLPLCPSSPVWSLLDALSILVVRLWALEQWGHLMLAQGLTFSSGTPHPICTPEPGPTVGLAQTRFPAALP